jgi:hypothetical protein
MFALGKFKFFLIVPQGILKSFVVKFDLKSQVFSAHLISGVPVGNPITETLVQVDTI